MLSEIIYAYRDPSNWRFPGSFALEGHLEIEDLAPYLIEPQPMLFEGYFFVPEIIGLPHLLSMPQKYYDHGYHEIEEIFQTNSGNPIMRSSEFISLCRNQNLKGWDNLIV